MELFKKSKKHISFVIVCILGAGQVGCDTFKKDIGLEKAGADPFTVQPISALEIPPQIQELPSDKPVDPKVLGSQKKSIPLKEQDGPLGEEQAAENRFLNRIKSQGLSFF
jgi:hypothetical protein